MRNQVFLAQIELNRTRGEIMRLNVDLHLNRAWSNKLHMRYITFNKKFKANC